MINLIPNQEKKAMIVGFYWRLATVLFGALGAVMLVAAIALLPAYFVSSAKKSTVIKKFSAETVMPENVAAEEILRASGALEKELTLLEAAERSKFLVTERVVNEIISKKMPDIKLSEISFDTIPAEGRKLSIRGTAPSRERLLQFRKALEDDSLFGKVDLPISNFIKGTNIQFSLSLMPK